MYSGGKEGLCENNGGSAHGRRRRRIRRTESGSITVFMAMTIMMILSLFFSLLEVVHYTALKRESVMVSALGMESMFADFNRPLWNDFDVLGIDGAYGGSEFNLLIAEERARDYLELNLSVPENSSGGNHLWMTPSGCSVVSYGLLTDDFAIPFMKECADATIEGMPADLLDELMGQARDAQDAEDNPMDFDGMLSGGADAMTQAAEEAESAEDSGNDTLPPMTEGTGSLSEEEIEKAGNPIAAIIEWKRKGILAQVLPAGMSASDKVFLTKDVVSKRSRNKGTLNTRLSLTMTERVLYQYYLLKHFGNFIEVREDAPLSYELEYIINGKEDDPANLSATAEKLLALRGAANMATLLTDSLRMGQAHSLAVALAGVTANPVIIAAVQAGIVAAWVYVESVLDVRTLLAGGKVAAAKTHMDWTSELTTLVPLLTEGGRAKESESGINYVTYLCAMLTLVPETSVGLRALDLIENELRTKEDYKNVKLDNFIYQASLVMEYEAAPIFGTLVTLAPSPDGYHFTDEETLFYTK